MVRRSCFASFSPNGLFFSFDYFYDGGNSNTPARSNLTGQFVYDDGGYDGLVQAGALGSTEFHGVEKLVIPAAAATTRCSAPLRMTC